MQGLVTVFGGSGFVGTQIVHALARQGWRIRIASRKPGRAYDTQPFGDVGQIQRVRADVTDRVSVARALEGAVACVNLPGVLHGKFEAIHVDGARNVAEACAALGVQRLVHISAIGADIDSPSGYARTKGEGEQAVRRAFPDATVLRPSIVFGPEDGFFNRFAAMASFSPVLPLFGGGETRYQPVYVGDVAQAVARALIDTAAPGQTYELAGPSTYTFKELMQLILRETGKARILLPLPHAAATMIGMVGNVQALVMEPILTTDQALLLRQDNVASPERPGLEALGVRPTSVEAIIPTYLWRYRKGGQFAEVAA